MRVLFGFYLAAFLNLSVFATCVSVEQYTKEDCTHPEKMIEKVLTAANQSQEVSEVLTALKIPKGTAVGALFSSSLQRSLGFHDPRIFVRTECSLLTFNLEKNSLEMAVLKQTADQDLKDSVGGGFGVLSASEGILLLDFPFPRKSLFQFDHVLNLKNPDFPTDWVGRYTRIKKGNTETAVWHDTHKCSGCHVDVKGTGGSLGQRKLRFEREKMNLIAVVSPSGNEGRGSDYCVPKDLELLYECRCNSSESPKCRSFYPTKKPANFELPAKSEACARLRVVISLRPQAYCPYALNEEKPFGRCFSDKE